MDVTRCCIAFVRLYFKFNSEFLRARKIKNKHFYDIKTLRDELKLLASFFLLLFSHAVNVCCPLSALSLSRCRDVFKQLQTLFFSILSFTFCHFFLLAIISRASTLPLSPHRFYFLLLLRYNGCNFFMLHTTIYFLEHVVYF